MASSWPLRSNRLPAASPEGILRPAGFLLPILVVLLPLLPPETRGESLSGASALIALLALLVPPAGPGGARSLLLALAVSSAAAVFLYPPAAVEPLAIALLAGAAGVHAAALPEAFRSSVRIPASLAAAAAIVSLHALVQKFWGFHALAEQVSASPWIANRAAILTRLEEGRAFAAFATPAALGGFLSLAIPVTVALALQAGRRARIALFVAAAIEIGGLLCAASMTAVGALLAALALAGISRKVPARAVAVGAAVLLTVVAAIATFRGREVLDARHPGSPWTLRAGNFRAAFEMARDHPWAGVSPGRFGDELSGYLRAGDNETRYAHDLPLHLAAETGFPVSVVLSSVFFVLFLGPVLSRRTGAGPPWQGGARIGLAAFALQNLGDFTAFLPSALWLAALLRGAVGGRAGEEAQSPPAAPRALRWSLAGGALLAAVACVFGGLGWNARVDAREFLAVGDLPAAVSIGRRAAALAPWSTEARATLAWALLARGTAPGGSRDDLREALSAADQAVALDPARPGLRDLRARARTALGDLPGAYSDLAEAARRYPLRTEYARGRDAAAAALPRSSTQGGEP